MAVAANIDVNLRANTRKFDDGVKRSQKNLTAFQSVARSPVFSKLGGQFTSIATAATPLAASLGVLGVAGAGLTSAFRSASAAIAQTIEELDGVIKTSRRLGFVTAEFQSLAFAADHLSGVSAPQFAMAMQRMTRRLSEAAAGVGEARKAIAELGLDAAELNRAGPAEAFKRISESIQAVESPADRLRIAFKLFDSEGAALVTTLSAGRLEIEALEERFRSLGGAMAEIDATAIEAAQDAMSDLNTATEALGITVATNVGPTVTTIVGDLTGAVADLNGATKESSQSLLDLGVRAASAAGGFLGFVAANRYMSDVNERTSAAAEAMRDAAAGAQELNSALSADTTAEMARNMATLEQAAERLRARIATPMETFSAGVKQAFELMDKGLITTVEYMREITRLKEVYENAMKGMETDTGSLVTAFDEMKKKATDAIDSIVRSPFGLPGESLVSKIKEAFSGATMEFATAGAPAALEAGSQAAFSAFRRNQQAASAKAEERTAAATEEMRTDLKRLLRRGIVLGKAFIGGAR